MKTSTVNLVEIKDKERNLTCRDLLPGEYGRIINFCNDSTDINTGTIIYHAGDRCIVLKPSKDSKWQVNFNFTNELYKIKKVILGDFGFRDIPKPKPVKTFNPFEVKIIVETEGDMATLWGIFNVSQKQIKENINMMMGYDVVKEDWRCDAFGLWSAINKKVEEMTYWRDQ